MFSKKEKPKHQSRPAGSFAQFGIFDLPETMDKIGNDLLNSDDNDDDFEAELVALTGGDDHKGKLKRKVASKTVPKEHLDAMVAESLKTIDFEEDGEQILDGEDDLEILNELKMITENESFENVDNTSMEEHTSPPQSQMDNMSTQSTMNLLQERLRFYQIAENKAKQENELGKARRFNRAIKTLKQLISDAQAGKPIDENDIPPQLPLHATEATSVQKSVEMEPSEETNMGAEVDVTVKEGTFEQSGPMKTIDEEALKLLKSRQQEYKMAAVAWKKAGNMKEALQCVSVAKQFDIVISAVNAGETVDLSDMPPSPNTPGANISSEISEKAENETQGKSSTDAVAGSREVKSAGPENLEAGLKERLEVCRRIKATAESEGNSSKARRYGRICKQFEDAIRLHSRGKPVPIDELPTPPGFEPLSVTLQSSVPLPAMERNEDPVPQVKSASEPSDKASGSPKYPVSPHRTQAGKAKQNQKTSRAEKQLALLQQRQHELKQAALNAKKEGDLELARNYLRQAKGIDPLIEASSGGLPVDMNSIPLSPKSKTELSAEDITGVSDESFTVINTLDCLEEASGTDEEIYENMEGQLTKQIKWCLCTRDHSKALGDVPGYNRWERLALSYKRDLDMLRVRKRDALPPPQHHYETKTYAIVQSCTDLSDGDIEISIIRGVNYSKDADTYVIFEFPYPSDNPPTDRTATVKGTCNPEYEAVFSLTGIDRSSRQCQRAFKRHSLKCQVWSKGGFFRSDSLLGTVTVKLQPLETQCVLHDSFPLMDGRKATGGKLELKIRLRNPILTKQIEQITDKWLTIDY